MAVMTSNHPVVRLQWLRRRMYVNFPTDLRPSNLARLMAHAGTALEFAVLILMVVGEGGAVTRQDSLPCYSCTDTSRVIFPWLCPSNGMC